mmetsp:Transcript_1474/g.2593  ORF Transcript_1474/g.2593 Transcript_1474/m.2593 type:complete len:145 (-) Transcript_1474:105-539(-)
MQQLSQSTMNERKIDNSQFEPISHKKTLTMINYFILNTSQFLNSFSNVADKKIHDIDEKLDRLETLIQIFETKMGSLPPEAFEHEPPPVEEAEEDEDGQENPQQNLPNLALTDNLNPTNYLAHTDNALNAVDSNPKPPPPPPSA